MKLKNKQTEEQTNVITVKIEDLRDFEGHPFKVCDNEDMAKLMESIKENGVLTPILVTKFRPEEKKYMIVSGHRRVTACKKLGITEIPAVCKDMNRTEAVIAMVDANITREHILPSEKAKAYRMRMEALSCQGQRTDLTSSLFGTRLRSDEQMAKMLGESRNQIQRYIRLTSLMPPLLTMVDEGRLGFSPAVELSFLKRNEQEYILKYLKETDNNISVKQAVALKKLSQEYKFIAPSADDILAGGKSAKSDVYKVPAKKLNQLAPNVKTNDELLDYLSKACAYYEKHLREEINAD